MQSRSRPRNIFERIYDEIGIRASQQLFDEVVRGDGLTPSFTLAKFAALAFATAIHGSGMILAWLGIYFLTKWPNLFSVFIGLVCLFLAYGARPRFNKIPNDVISRVHYPEFYELADAVANKLSAPKIDGVVITPQYNASFSKVGWQQKRVLYLGLPLFATLNDDEKIALIAHEIAHDINGDVNRGLWIGTAINTLNNWYKILRPPYLLERNFFMTLSNIVTQGLSIIPAGGAYLLSHLLWRDLQRAEYLADLKAASISGVPTMTECLYKLYYVNSFVIGSSNLFWSKKDVFKALRARLQTIGGFDRESLKQLENGDEMRLNSSHPPTIFRIKLLLTCLLPDTRLTLTPQFFDELEMEITPLEQKVQARITDLYEASLY